MSNSVPHLRRRQRAWRLRQVAALVLVILASGCFTASYLEGDEIPWEQVARIEPGRTSRGEVLAWLGAPRNFSNTSALAAFLEYEGLESDHYAQYPFTDVFVYQVERARLEGLTLLVFNRVDVRVVSDVLLVMFDDHGRVEHVGVHRASALD